VDRFDDDRFGPIRSFGEVAGSQNLSITQVQNELRSRATALVGIALGGVVENPELREMREQIDEVDATVVVALSNFVLRDIMSTVTDATANPRKMKLRTGEGDEPYTDR
jgi:hypothetical protein